MDDPHHPLLTNKAIRDNAYISITSDFIIIELTVDKSMRNQHPIEIFRCANHDSGVAFFSDPLLCDETLIAEVKPSPNSDLYCHRNQTDQLMVLRGSLDLMILQNKTFQCIHLCDTDRLWVKIPPCIPHAAINRTSESVVLVNAIQRHGPVDPRDYKARPIPNFLQQEWRRLQAS